MITLKIQLEKLWIRPAIFLQASIGLRDIIKPGVDMWVEEYVRRRCKRREFFFHHRLVLISK